MRRHQPRALRAVLLILCGAAINLVVAWAVALYSHPTTPSIVDPRTIESWPDWAPTDWPSWREACAGQRQPVARAQSLRGLGSQSVTMEVYGVMLVNRLSASSLPPSNEYVEASATSAEFGLPLRSLSMEYGTMDPLTAAVKRLGSSAVPVPEAIVIQQLRQVPTGTQHLRAPGVLGGSRLPWNASGDRLLPLAPVWPGFIVNTAVYASLLAVLLLGAQRLVAWRRLRNGRCAACGYDVTGTPTTVCPECGAATV